MAEHTYALRGTLPGGGLVQHPLPFTEEPSLEEAMAKCAALVARMSDETVWTVESDEKPEPKPAKTEAAA